MVEEKRSGTTGPLMRGALDWRVVLIVGLLSGGGGGTVLTRMVLGAPAETSAHGSTPKEIADAAAASTNAVAAVNALAGKVDQLATKDDLKSLTAEVRAIAGTASSQGADIRYLQQQVGNHEDRIQRLERAPPTWRKP